MLSHDNKREILCEFPNIKLSYENITHKKVLNADVVLAIPRGKKCFAWFTTYNDQDVCFVMELSFNKQILNIRIVKTKFDSSLTFNTILYGTLFYCSNVNFFTVEDVYYYKGKDVSRYSWGEKFVVFQKLMEKDIHTIVNPHVVFGLPIMSTKYDDLVSKINGLNYNIENIQFRTYTQSNVSTVMSFKNIGKIDVVAPEKSNGSVRIERAQRCKNIGKFNVNVPAMKEKRNREVIFAIKPDLQNDIYHLYCSDDKTYDIAYIPDFKTSKWMNDLFRNIKENKNLDALEESDDEDDFENDKIDRHVFMDKTFKMICAYNNKFRRWYPLRLAEESTNVVERRELIVLEKK